VAEPSIAELEARLAAATEVIPRIDALSDLAWALRTDDVPRAHVLSKEARALAIEHKQKLQQARAARTMAMTIGDTDDLHQIIRLADESKDLFDEVGDAAGRAASRDFLASIYEYIGEATIALDLALDALSIARALGDPTRQGYALSSVGGLLAASGDLEGGLERLHEALGIFEAAQDIRGITTICTRLCRVLKSAGRREEALRYAERCRDIGEETQNEWSYATALSVMAELEEERGRVFEAGALYRESLTSMTTETIRALLGSGIQVAFGRLLIKQGALDDAARELNDALGRIEGNPVSIVTQTSVHEALADLCERQGALREAIDHLRKAQGLREKIGQREARNKLAQVEARASMEAAKKDAEIHRLRFVELHGMQSKLVEAEKMALLGTLAAGAAHELNTPLGVLRNNTQLSATATARLLELVRGEELGARVAKLGAVLESCRESTAQAVERISAVAESFMRFTQLDQAQVRAFDVREGLESALSLLEPGIPPGITLERRFEVVPPIQAWPRELNQALFTVLRNAVQAIDGSGVVSAETGAADGHVFVRVRDSGRGMSAEKAARLFDMGWSEEGARTKMRMGLCAAHATTLKHGGAIAVQSKLGQGTTVTFTFPISARAT
jgi:two-component system, NtrC family, sensor kinase